ncbi:MAG: cytosine permease [Nitrososphaerota archaeon]|nr:cytosine permease [Candidatus Calditenuaceae archaeon]MDW8073873.1 cytosine permease [Nitrososphaerota archaeon]
MSEEEVKDYYGDFANVRVPLHERRTMVNQLIVFLGVLAVWAAVFGGAALATWFGAIDIIIVSVLGCIVLGLLAFLTATIGGRTYASTYVILRHSMGRAGAIIAGIVISGISATLWFAFETWLFGVIMAGTFPGVPGMDVGTAAIWGGILMMITAAIGYRGLSVLSYFIVPAWFVIVTLALTAAIDVSGGWAALLAARPPAPADIATGITFVVGLYIVGATIAPDVTRFSRKPYDGAIAWFIHVVFFMPLILAAGGFLQLLAPGQNLVGFMVSMGMVWAVLLTGVLGQWTTNDNNLYSASLAWCNAVPKVKRVIWVIVMGVGGTAVAALIGYGYGVSLDALLAFGTFLGTFIPPFTGVMIADYFIVRPYILGARDPRTRYPFGPGTEYAVINWPAAVAVVVASFLAWYVPQLDSRIPAFLVGLLTSSLLHIVLMAVSKGAKIRWGVGRWVETPTGW